MRTLSIVAAFALLALSAPTFAQISAGVGHKLQEESPNSAASSPEKKGSASENEGSLSEGRAAAPSASVGDKGDSTSEPVRNDQNKQEMAK